MGLPRKAMDVQLVARPASVGESVKTAAFDAVYGARSQAEQIWDDFKGSDRFFKYKAAIVGSWLLISIATVIIASTGGQRPLIDTSNAIGAFGKFQRSADLGVSALLLENHSSDTWKQVALTLDGAYSSLVPKIAPGGRAVIELRKFNGAAGGTPPADLRPQRLEIRCSEGTAVVDLTENP
jgi:hypothetical protein